MTKNSPSFDQADKIRSGRRPLTRTRPKKIQPFSNNLKKSKDLKIHKITYKFFFDLAPTPLMPYPKMILMVTLRKPAVKKTTNFALHDLQKRPIKTAMPMH